MILCCATAPCTAFTRRKKDAAPVRTTQNVSRHPPAEATLWLRPLSEEPLVTFSVVIFSLSLHSKVHVLCTSYPHVGHPRDNSVVTTEASLAGGPPL